AESADILVGSFAGIQAMSQALTDYHDLTDRVRTLLHHLLPNIIHASILTTLDLAPTRGQTVYNELTTTPHTTT
ncbi:TetR/AcrR family transcriptional regulator, partial [Streptomyces sp. NPDC058603]